MSSGDRIGDGLDGLRGVPELYRARAQSAAGLAMTAAAAISAGAILGAARSLPDAAAVCALIATGALLVAVTFFVLASQYARQGTANQSDIERQVVEISSSIRFRMLVGDWAAVLAMVAFVVMVTITLFSDAASFHARVKVDDMAAASLPPSCVTGDGMVIGRISSDQVSTSRDFMRIVPDSANCRRRLDAIYLSRSDIQTVEEAG